MKPGLRLPRNDDQRILRPHLQLRRRLLLHVPDGPRIPVQDPGNGRAGGVWLCHGPDGQVGGDLDWHYCCVSVFGVGGVGFEEDLDPFVSRSFLLFSFVRC